MTDATQSQEPAKPEVNRIDLFGDPVPANWGGRGRPEHIATAGNCNKVLMLLALGWNNQRIAQALGITVPTLRKSYRIQLKRRDEQRDRLNAALAVKLWEGVQAGNVSAIREFQAFLERNDLMQFGQTAPPATPDKPEKPQKLGKKDQALEDANKPDPGSKLGELMAARQGGDALN